MFELNTIQEMTHCSIRKHSRRIRGGGGGVVQNRESPDFRSLEVGRYDNGVGVLRVQWHTQLKEEAPGVTSKCFLEQVHLNKLLLFQRVMWYSII